MSALNMNRYKMPIEEINDIIEDVALNSMVIGASDTDGHVRYWLIQRRAAKAIRALITKAIEHEREQN